MYHSNTIVQIIVVFDLSMCTLGTMYVCEAKPTTLKRPSPGEGLRITCFVPTIVEA